ncbi:hypothetical protein LINPERHAP2_LOCUS17108 [Linum perenne]
MSRKLPQIWAKKGAVRVSDVRFGYYVVNFETISNYDPAMFGGPWMVNDHYVVIQEWRPYFRPEETFLSTLRVWVRLPGIPFEYFDRKILQLIGDHIGKTVRIDHTTLEGSRWNFARICVRLTYPNLFFLNTGFEEEFVELSTKGYTSSASIADVMGIKLRHVSRLPRRRSLTIKQQVLLTRSSRARLSMRIDRRLRRISVLGCKSKGTGGKTNRWRHRRREKNRIRRGKEISKMETDSRHFQKRKVLMLRHNLLHLPSNDRWDLM